MRALFVLSALAIAVAGFVILLLVRSIMVRSTEHLLNSSRRDSRCIPSHAERVTGQLCRDMANHVTHALTMQPNNFFFRNKTLEITNVIASSVLLVITVITMVAFTRRWFNCLRRGMRW